ncbi:hypothetical protein LX70_01325 [Defluviimonas denitrificans]|jgi:hypothetical protein|uniref:Uncharacterized protein n=1 Tax=Albidovulum denitrificans TaxID=404881 RepID=A0A2S8S9P6_9RHOB|nr:hypothetical protein [Defluviimonas denitrificans]PQV57520.1 hypothetical protein LX70_01325 [Defluviimonas denitrificans]
MSDPLSNAEIQDVLSSIRRLVSEDRRLRTPVPVAEEEEGAGKLLLTDALRVESPAAEVEETPEDAPEEASLVNVVSEEEQDARWPVHVSEIPAAPAIRPASALEEDLATLESTIAELEAAVAGIGAEFEPDGSEVAKDSADPSALALEEAFDDGFVVDTGGPVPVRPDDPSISAGVTEDTALAPEAEEVAEAEEATTEDATAEPAEDHGTDEITFLRSGPAGRRSDWQVISGDMDGQGNTGRLHLTASDAVEGSGEDAEADGAVAEGADTPEMAEDATLEVVSAEDEAAEVAEEQGPEAETPDLAGEAYAAPETPEAAYAAPEDVESAEVAFAEADPVETPEAVEDAVAEADLPDAADVAPEGDPMPAAAMAGAAAMAAVTPDEGEEDGVDLFSQDDEAVIDMEMLRDLISEVIREELQGPLGERITRNVRKLVRQEIARALEAQKFE